VYDAQNIAIVSNALARVERLDLPLLTHLSYMVQQMHPDQFDAQAVANIVNAYIKLDVPEEVASYLLEYMSVVTQILEVETDFTPQAISNIANAYARTAAVPLDRALFAHLAMAAQRLPPASFNAQAVANIVNAYAKVAHLVSTRDAAVDLEPLFNHMSPSRPTRPAAPRRAAPRPVRPGRTAWADIQAGWAGRRRCRQSPRRRWTSRTWRTC
jgi:hypothetical protein